MFLPYFLYCQMYVAVSKINDDDDDDDVDDDDDDDNDNSKFRR